jgi:metal-responsive CopG/Arc/MetJ family transcriptional regulator
MDQVRVNLTLDKEIWQALDSLAPQRKKSKLVNDLLKKEIQNIKQKEENNALAMAFEEASKDKSRLAVVAEWETLDKEEWR